jgi:hypothetical protein
MSKLSPISSALVLMAMTAAVSSAQSVTSAHSGTLHYFEGDISVDGTPVQTKAARFSDIREQSVLSTGLGRAEVLLTPGVFLRIGENSSIKMLDNRLISTRVEIISGNVIVESDDPQMSIKDSPVSLIYKDYEIRLVKHGLLEISTDPAQMKVYNGEAVVDIAGGNIGSGAANNRATVKEGRLLNFSAALLTENFNAKVGDDLYIWARDRSQSISAANMSSARSINSGGYGSGYGNGFRDSSGYGLGSGFGSGYGYGGGYGGGLGGWNSGWYYNPYLDMFTYVPGAGTYWNAFGYGFFSPGTIYDYYSPSSYWYGGGGARGTGSIGRPLEGGSSSTTTRAPLSSLFPKTPRGGVSGVGSPSAPGASTTSLARSGFSSGGFSSSRGGGGAMASGGGHGGGGHR